MLQGNALPKAKPRGDTRQRLSGLLTPQVMQVAGVMLAILLITAALYLYVLPNSQIDRARVRIAGLQGQRAALERENAALQQEIALYAHLGVIEARAQALGMRPAGTPLFVTMPSAATAATDAVVAETGNDTDASATSVNTLPLRQSLAELRRRLDLAVNDLLGRPRGQ